MEYTKIKALYDVVDAQNDFSATDIDADVLLMEQELEDNVKASIERLAMLSRIHRGPLSH